MLEKYCGVYGSNTEHFVISIDGKSLFLNLNQSEKVHLLEVNKDHYKSEDSQVHINFIRNDGDHIISIKVTMNGKTVIANRKTVDLNKLSEQSIVSKFQDLSKAIIILIIIIVVLIFTKPLTQKSCLENNSINSCRLAIIQSFLTVKPKDSVKYKQKAIEIEKKNSLDELKLNCESGEIQACDAHANVLLERGLNNKAINLFKQNCNDDYIPSCRKLRNFFHMSGNTLMVTELDKNLCSRKHGEFCHHIAKYAKKKSNLKRYLEYLKKSCQQDFLLSCFQLATDNNSLNYEEKLDYIQKGCHKDFKNSCDIKNEFEQAKQDIEACNNNVASSCYESYSFHKRYFDLAVAEVYLEKACKISPKKICN
tara:strand:+ start:26056 stop:27153 length:1098 start_codon:yes stop_codon:yes gene_type:complete